jgi:hypothetical protein
VFGEPFAYLLGVIASGAVGFWRVAVFWELCGVTLAHGCAISLTWPWVKVELTGL